MKYLFFDCECANCYNHEGKICSFGYVITDEAFHVKEQKDIIINPDAPFDPHVLGQGERSIDLAYTPLRFEHAPKFDAYYGTIVGLLTDPETRVFGYAIENDVGFLVSECRRYHKDIPLFSYDDIQTAYQAYAGWDRSPSLEDALKELGVNYDEYAEHCSADDAEMSMLLLKKMVATTGLDTDSLLSNYPSSHDDVTTFLLQEALVKEIHQNDFALSSVDASKLRDLNSLIYYVPEDPANRQLQDKTFLLSPSLRADPDLALDLANEILDGDGRLIRYLKEANYFLVKDEAEKTLRRQQLPLPNLSILTLEEFEALRQ
jgi:DNA polymerase III epsilon subunit-like protein